MFKFFRKKSNTIKPPKTITEAYKFVGDISDKLDEVCEAFNTNDGRRVNGTRSTLHPEVLRENLKYIREKYVQDIEGYSEEDYDTVSKMIIIDLEFLKKYTHYISFYEEVRMVILAAVNQHGRFQTHHGLYLKSLPKFLEDLGRSNV